jgi:Ca2+-binding EF-hand superfamily protein
MVEIFLPNILFYFSLSIETISETDFRFLMQQTGEQLSKDSVDDMIQATDARTKNGRIQYRKLVSTLIHL